MIENWETPNNIIICEPNNGLRKADCTINMMSQKRYFLVEFVVVNQLINEYLWSLGLNEKGTSLCPLMNISNTNKNYFWTPWLSHANFQYFSWTVICMKCELFHYKANFRKLNKFSEIKCLKYEYILYTQALLIRILHFVKGDVKNITVYSHWS